MFGRRAEPRIGERSSALQRVSRVAGFFEFLFFLFCFQRFYLRIRCLKMARRMDGCSLNLLDLFRMSIWKRVRRKCLGGRGGALTEHLDGDWRSRSTITSLQVEYTRGGDVTRQVERLWKDFFFSHVHRGGSPQRMFGTWKVMTRTSCLSHSKRANQTAS